MNHCNCPNCQTENCPAGIELDTAQAEMEECVRSHQKQNALVARFEAVFCDDHLDNLPSECPACERDQIQQEVEMLKAPLQKFVDHYPHGVNPYLDSAKSEGHEVLARLKEKGL